MMPYFHLGNLNCQRAKSLFSRMEIKEILCQVLQALAFFKIAHRDVKPENILVEPRNDPFIRIRLADFGLSKYAEDGRANTGRAPEMFIPEYWCFFSVDIWSAGVMVLGFEYGLPNLPDDDERKLASAIAPLKLQEGTRKSKQPSIVKKIPILWLSQKRKCCRKSLCKMTALARQPPYLDGDLSRPSGPEFGKRWQSWTYY